MADGCLHAEAVQGRAKNLVVVKAVDQRFAQRYFIGHRAIDYALVQVGGPQSPNLAAKGNVVTVVDFGKMVEGTWLFGKWKKIFASVVLNLDESFFNIDVGSAILSHGAQLYQMTIGLKFLDGKEHVQRAH